MYVGHEEVTSKGVYEHGAVLQFSLSKEGALHLNLTAECQSPYLTSCHVAN
jgi:hypothetical protein